MINLKTLAMLVLAGALGLTACEKSDPFDAGGDEDRDDEEIIIESEFGKFTTSDEAPAFGDAELAAEVADEVAVTNDLMSTDTEVIDAISGRAAVPVIFLRLTWGHLEFDSTATEVIDWSGSIEVNRGKLAALRTIKFEDGDHIVWPRESKQRVEFTSHTQPHFDGLALAIVDKDTSDVEGILTIHAGPYSRSIAFSELDSLEMIEQVDDLGNEFSIVSHSKSIERQAPGGFFAGKWIRKGERSGEFKGRWISKTGDTVGHLKGRWGFSTDGAQVFAGKVIDANGQFVALIAGHWDTHGHGRNMKSGWLRGRWVNENHEEMGRLSGVWHTGNRGDNRGFFHGHWSEKIQEQSDGGDNQGN